jgi:hypothetical protein
MAKTSKKPKLTEEEKDLVEQRFQQFRDQALRQWYEQLRRGYNCRFG